MAVPKTNKKWDWDGPLQNSMNKLLETGLWSDLVVIFGKQELLLHTLVLRAGSPVFDKKITAAIEATGRLQIDDEDPNIFKMMINYLYTGKSDVTMSDALPLLKMASDYAIPGLVVQCESALKGKITAENALYLFHGAMDYAHQNLIQTSLDYICENATSILTRDEFAHLRLECLIEIIQQDRLRVVDEMEVFTAVYRWGEAECTRQKLDPTDTKELRKVLKKPLQHVRFPLMDSAKFALNVATKNILDMEESMALLICFLVPPEKRGEIPQGRFSSTPRAQILSIPVTNNDDMKFLNSRKSGYPVLSIGEAVALENAQTLLGPYPPNAATEELPLLRARDQKKPITQTTSFYHYNSFSHPHTYLKK